MGFSKNDFDKVDLRIKNITEQTVEQIEVGNMDTKVSFALALAGVLIGVIFEKGMPSAFERITEVSKLAELSGGEIIAAILVALLYLSSFISILCFMLSIIARVKNLNNAPSIFSLALLEI